MSSTLDRVAYKPLAPELDDDDDAELTDGEEPASLSLASSGRIFNPRASVSSNYNLPSSLLNKSKRFGLRQLRVILYVVAITLFLVFMAQLTTNDKTSRESLSQPTHQHQHSNDHQVRHHQIEDRELTSEGNSIHYTKIESQPMPTQEQNSIITPQPQPKLSNRNYPLAKNFSRPQYRDYITSIRMAKEALDADGQPIDDFHYPDRQRFANSDPKKSVTDDVWWAIGTRDSGNYITVTDYIRAMKSFNPNTSITLTTQATVEFMHHTLELCKRWDGPISVAVYAPGSEFRVATTLIKYMRQCLPIPLSFCIRDKVTWHLVYHRDHKPAPGALRQPKHHLDSENFPSFARQDGCPVMAGPEPTDSIQQFEEKLRRANGMWPSNYRQQHQLQYPINVVRNTARLAAYTHYILASDIELYPSVKLVPMFAKFITKHNIRQEFGYVDKFVFTLPIFEVKAQVKAPKTKDELVKLFKRGDAIFFHKWVCDACQNFPSREDWLKTDRNGLPDYRSDEDEVVIFDVTQRDRTRSSWEPIFIGTNEEPLYNDRLNWDGRRDKMGQMYELCLQNYYLIVLGNAFLVHAPGIKHIDNNDVMKRINFIRDNNAIYDADIANLKLKYANSSNIEKC